MKELEKVYNPKLVEDKIYQRWLEKKYFHAEIDKSKKPFSIVMPPPNITGQLHMGHALDNTLQDILTRYKRMQGYAALWIPGTDHAAIATEVKIIEAMRKEEGLTKEDIGREAFLERAWEWKEKYAGRITEQLKKLGVSCDWDRQRFTMDEGCSNAVKEVFVNLYNKGLIYRGQRIISWCPSCLTALSDAEVEFEEQEGSLWHIKYPIKDSNEYIVVATTRPETMIGDSGVCVAPDDERYTHLIGKTCILPLVGREIPIFADSYVEKEFGTGAVKMTPAHDPNDYEVGQRHNLEVIKILTDDAHMADNTGKYAGMDRYEARKAIVKDLQDQGYLVKTEKYAHNVGTCYRCHNTIEPMVSNQWFVKMEPLAKPAIEAVKNGDTKFIPERFDKIYFHWMENIKDWCISRQIWWGHRIPAWYCDDCGEIIVSKEAPCECPKCHSKKLRQDEDTLDTWFSSALWPFSTMGWPDKDSEDLKFFYPTDTLVTGYDIIFFWVARMMFSGLEHMGEVPFKNVLIHGIVRDANGVKMSKSLGNGIDPLEVIDQYGADALRFTLATGSSAGNDTRYSEEKVKASRNFANKLWNAARFILMNIDGEIAAGLPEKLEQEDKWIISAFNRTAKAATENLDNFDTGLAAQKAYDFIWDDFCDKYIEIAKTRLNGTDEEAKNNVRRVLVYVMSGALKLLHPVMPFITEEIYTALPNSGESIMISDWPNYREELNFEKEENSLNRIFALAKEIRALRAQLGAHPTNKTHLIIETEYTDDFERGLVFVEKFAFAKETVITTKFEGDASQYSQIVVEGARAFIPTGDLIDREKEIARLNKELAAVEKDIRIISGKLNNRGFLSKAPRNVVEGERTKLAGALDKKEKILASLAALG
ncbi:MAG: valine--tRNA ligase [Oscillospiraceae bacterium]|nr:valine--tRNA ligase [Oscillospiraceae bacterium]